MIRQIVLSHSIFFVSFRTNSHTYRPAEKHFESLRNCFHKFPLRLSDHRPVRKNADNADPVFLRRSTSSAASRTPASLAYSFSKTDRPCAGIFFIAKTGVCQENQNLFFLWRFFHQFSCPPQVQRFCGYFCIFTFPSNVQIELGIELGKLFHIHGRLFLFLCRTAINFIWKCKAPGDRNLRESDNY